MFRAVPMNPYVGVLKEGHGERRLGASDESDAPESEEDEQCAEASIQVTQFRG